MKKQTLFIIAGILAISAGLIMAHDMPPPTQSTPQFDQVKKLVGHWEGMNKMNNEDQKVTVDYKLSSGGTAVVETLSAGTPHEMTSVYYLDKSGVNMTHYCMLGNQPNMKLTKSSDKDLVFDFAK